MPISSPVSKKRFPLVLAATLTLGLLAGCGGGGASQSSGTTGTTGTTGSGGTVTTAAAVYVVGSAALPAGATRVATLAAVPWSSLPAGSQVLVSPGAWSGVTTITATGTRAAPIVVTAADTADPPVLSDSVDFQHAGYVQLTHVTVQSPTYAGVIIRLASHHITVADSTINAAPVGISITDGAGTGHQLLRNTIADSANHGISVEVNADPAERTLIAHNQVMRSGQHGIEVRASHYQVDANTVSASGQAGGGTSGIHLYSGSASEDSGDDNLVRWNLSYANQDAVAADGNGIEVDQWCDGNTVAYNLVWANDGAGVIVFDGSDNIVQGNTAWGNGLDPGRTHVALGQIIVSGTAAATVQGNQVWDNLAASTLAGVPAIYVDSRAVAGVNAVGPNFYANAAGGTLLRWTDAATRQAAALIDATTGTTGNLVATPAFADPAHPLAGGLRLASAPALPGRAPAADQLDLAGALPPSGGSYFGAYFTAP